MSKTDKTDPDWVHCWWEPHHHIWCRKSTWSYYWCYECDLPDGPPNGPPIRNGQGSRCCWQPDTPSYYSNAGRKFYGRRQSRSQDENLFERGVRAAWRDCAKKLLATPIGEIDDVVLPDPRHRHFALWDEW